ncbi:MAG: 2-hydroxychromene-2-carboxylate isomerase [Burkholderiales bacterium]|jgi:2-hydroxychromene-2-carboxylate isomerase|nr:2-hydroxychromene-2-carboxylate isomerase [Burkholderiales bacterium]
MPRHVDYYFSPMSPWTHLGHARFREIAKRHGATVAVKPVDYGRVFPASGGVPLKQRPPQRQAYRMHELKRWRDYLGVPIQLEPKFFPIPTDLAAKVIIAAAPRGAEKQLDLAGAILKACWQEDKDISQPATLEALANGVGLDGAALVKAASEPAAQAEYDRLTQEAIDRQVFGAPTYLIGDEPFWGQDRLDFVDRALAQ